MMTKTQFVAALAEKNGMTKKAAAQVFKAFTDSVTETLADGDALQLIGFGTFEVRRRAARRGRNPVTGKRIRIKAHKVALFRAGQLFKNAVN